MKASDVWLWSFSQNPTDISEIKCLECEEFSPLAEWTEGYVGCDTCGDHSAMCCPKCDECHDHVHSSHHPMEVRQPEKVK